MCAYGFKTKFEKKLKETIKNEFSALIIDIRYDQQIKKVERAVRFNKVSSKKTTSEYR